MSTNHAFTWHAVNDTGPIYKCSVCGGTLLVNTDRWSVKEFQNGDYRIPPADLNDIPGNRTCEEVIARFVQEA